MAGLQTTAFDSARFRIWGGYTDGSIACWDLAEALKCLSRGAPRTKASLTLDSPDTAVFDLCTMAGSDGKPLLVTAGAERLLVWDVDGLDSSPPSILAAVPPLPSGSETNPSAARASPVDPSSAAFESVVSLARGPGSWVWTGMEDGTVRAVDIATGSMPVLTRCHRGSVRGIAALPGLHAVVSVGEDGAIRLQDSRTRRVEELSLVPQTARGGSRSSRGGPLTSIAVDDGEQWLAVGAQDGTISRIHLAARASSSALLVGAEREGRETGAIRRVAWSGGSVVAVDELGGLAWADADESVVRGRPMGPDPLTSLAIVEGADCPLTAEGRPWVVVGGWGSGELGLCASPSRAAMLLGDQTAC